MARYHTHKLVIVLTFIFLCLLCTIDTLKLPLMILIDHANHAMMHCHRSGPLCEQNFSLYGTIDFLQISL